MNKEKIELLSKIVPIGGVFIILCSSIKHVLFYDQFNINITEFLTIGEYATLFVDDILGYLIIFGGGILHDQFVSKTDLIDDDNLIYVLLKKERIGIIVISILAIIGISVSLFFIESFSVKLGLIKFGVFFLAVLIYLYFFFKKARLYLSYSGLMVLAILFNSSMDGLINAQEIKENKNKLNYTITFNNQTITTNDDLHFLGKSDRFIYLYFLTKKESMILPTSSLREIQIVEKKKKR